MDHVPTPEEIEFYSNGHSVFAPSSAAMHITCSGSLLANFGRADEGSPDAAYGTVGHSLGEGWLNSVIAEWDRSDPSEIMDYAPMGLVGVEVEVSSSRGHPWLIEIDEDMIAFVARYVNWCAVLEGDHFVETRVSHEDLCPIPGQGGTADHAACMPGLLVITDLKMGRGEAVYPADDLDDPRSIIDGRVNGNAQAMIYAYGFIREWTWKYDFKKVIIRIAQPPRDYFGEWHTTVDEIMRFAGYYTARAALNWKAHQPRTASLKGCRWCKDKANCGTWLVFWDELHDGIFDPVVDGEFREVSSEEIQRAGNNIAVKMAFGDDKSPMPRLDKLTTHQKEYIKYWRKAFEHFFSEIDADLLHLARDGEKLALWKRVPGRQGRRTLIDDLADYLEFIGIPRSAQTKRVACTVVELENYLRKTYKLTKRQAEILLSDCVQRADGQDTLALLRDEREKLPDLSSVFDPVTDFDDDNGL